MAKLKRARVKPANHQQVLRGQIGSLLAVEKSVYGGEFIRCPGSFGWNTG